MKPLRALFFLALPLHGAIPTGAKVPFTTLEAEQQKTTGTVVTLKDKPGSIVTPEMEASGRGFVELSAAGQALRFPITAAANTIVIRHCIPDAPAGGGTEATLSLFVNNKFAQSLKLSSRHNWTYGEPGQNGQSDMPGKAAHVFWDETRYFLTTPLKPGDQLDLRRQDADTAAYYRIDLVDLEQAPPPLPAPAAGTFLSVADFGANGADEADDSDAILACIKAADEQDKIVWIPAGTYRQTKHFALKGPITIKGAGMWHTNLLGMEAAKDWSGKMGFSFKGDGCKVSDLYLECVPQTFRGLGGKGFTSSSAKNWSVENVWITHTQVGFWMSATSKGLVRDCRVRFTYADGINLNRGTSDSIVENNHLRGCGDDGLAILSETERTDPPAKNNILRNNTVSAIWWGHNCDLAGGSNHLVEGNLLADNAMMGVFTINMTGAFPNHPLSDSIVRRNALIRGGGNYVNQKRGAAWIYADSTTVTDVLFEENYIGASMYSAIQITGKSPQKMVFKDNVIEGTGGSAIVITGVAKGSGEFTGNKITGLPEGAKEIANGAGDAYTVISK
jgi:hypothetical protein